MLVSIVVYAVSFVLIRMLSRYRELAADRSGALLVLEVNSMPAWKGLQSVAPRDIAGLLARYVLSRLA